MPLRPRSSTTFVVNSGEPPYRVGFHVVDVARYNFRMSSRYRSAPALAMVAIVLCLCLQHKASLAQEAQQEQQATAPTHEYQHGGMHMHMHHRHYPAEKLPPGDSARGQAVFRRQNCNQCHATDAKTKSFGPNLAGMFNPAMHGHRMTDGDVEHQIRRGGGKMPPYAQRIAAQEMADLIAYLHTLSPSNAQAAGEGAQH